MCMCMYVQKIDLCVEILVECTGADPLGTERVKVTVCWTKFWLKCVVIWMCMYVD